MLITGNFSNSAGSASDFVITKEALTLFMSSEASSLSVQQGDALISFDLDAVAYILGQTIKETVISMDSLPPYSEEAKLAFGSRSLIQFSLTSDGSNAITSLPQGFFKISFPATNMTGNVIAGSLLPDGTVAYENKSYYTGTELLVLLDTFGTYSVATRENSSILDAFQGHWAEKYVAFADARGLYESLPYISPEESITRGMFVEILGRLEQLDADSLTATTQFQDVDASASYSPYVQWAYDNRIVGGTSPVTFEPNAPISREEMAVMLVAYINNLSLTMTEQVEPVDFDSEYISDWAVNSVNQAQAYGLIAGKTPDYFDALGETTYGEHAVMVLELVENLVSVHTVHLD